MSVHLVSDGNSLLLAFRCQEPALEALVLKSAAGEMGRLWTDDSVEIFLDPEGKGLLYYHLILNAAGVWGGAVGPEAPWRPSLTVATGRYAGGWILEVAIPFEDLGITDISACQRWGANFCRNRLAGARSVSSWAWTGRSFHRPGRFGRLRFQKQ